MSTQNVELIRKAVEAFNRHDVEALAELSDEDLEFISIMTAVDAEGASYHGKGAWQSYFETMNDTWHDWRVEDLRVVDAGGDCLASAFRLVGTGKQSGVRIGQEIGIAYRIRDGKLWRMRSYLDATDALAAAAAGAAALQPDG